jgi:histidine ammonia-lyase
MIGRGDVSYRGKIVQAKKALESEKLTPRKLEAKEGIALINGTQAMLSMGVLAIIRLENLLKAADIAGALSVEGDRASDTPFDPRIHKLRPHPGQVATAANMRALLSGSSIIKSHVNCARVQDPYSFRCIPQVHGAVKDAVGFARETILREAASCTDSPLIFDADDAILSGGNFHGEPLAFAMDMIAIAAAELGSISERRVAILTAPLSGELKTKFLVPDPGLNSGLMIAHVTMSALVSENKTLAHPASVDSIPTSGGQEDHVSMGTIAAAKALQVLNNLEYILAIELFAACQAIELQREHGSPAKGTGAVLDCIRRQVPPIESDREYRHDIEKCVQLLLSGEIVAAAEKVCGKLKVC